PAAVQRKMGIVLGSVLQQGALGRRFDDVIRAKPMWLSPVRRAQFLAFYDFLDDLGMPIVELCLRFAISNKDASTVLIGAKTAERGYDLLAPKFDYAPFRTPQQIIDAVGRRLAALGPFRAGLDVCCGTGAAMAMLRPLCTERVVGIDFSHGMLEMCRMRTADA